jgi:hypothetical protein
LWLSNREEIVGTPIAPSTRHDAFLAPRGERRHLFVVGLRPREISAPAF